MGQKYGSKRLSRPKTFMAESSRNFDTCFDTRVGCVSRRHHTTHSHLRTLSKEWELSIEAEYTRRLREFPLFSVPVSAPTDTNRSGFGYTQLFHDFSLQRFRVSLENLFGEMTDDT